MQTERDCDTNKKRHPLKFFFGQALTMQNYAHSIYKLELKMGAYALDVSFPDMFEEIEVTKLPYHHIHAKYEMVFVCAKDGGEPRCFMVNPPRCKHATHFENQTQPLYLTSIRFAVKKRQGTDIRETAPGGSILDWLFALRGPVVVPDTFQGEARIHAVRRELREQKSGYLEVAQAELTLLLLELARHLPREQTSEHPVAANLDELKLDLIDEFFYQNYDRPDCKREDLAQMLCISERQLSRIFAQNYAMSFRERLLQTRMEMAEALRSSEHFSAEQLSEKVGYSSASAFRAAYKNYFGKSFKESRK